MINEIIIFRLELQLRCCLPRHRHVLSCLSRQWPSLGPTKVLLGISELSEQKFKLFCSICRQWSRPTTSLTITVFKETLTVTRYDQHAEFIIFYRYNVIRTVQMQYSLQFGQSRVHSLIWAYYFNFGIGKPVLRCCCRVAYISKIYFKNWIWTRIGFIQYQL